MIMLAVEMSSARGGAALFRGDELLGVEVWADRAARSQTLFGVLPRLLRTHALRQEHVQIYAVGRGPGSYTGLRVAMTAAQAFALPLECPVYAVNSVAALAAEWLLARHAEGVAVVGDARRGELWVRTATRTSLDDPMEYALIKTQDLPARLPAGYTVLSPDYEALAGVFSSQVLTGVKVVETPVYPDAEWVGRLVLDRLRRGVASEPLKPIYVHPPVFVPPSFPPSSA